ncbi:zinc finger, CCHC-type containing protein [Tanacetum coccineum]
MGNESTALVHGRGCVDLKFSSGKIVSLFNVLHVPNIRKNLVSSSVLNNCGYKQVIESNKFVLSKHGVFIGFGYLSNQMFRLNIVNDNIASAFMSTSKLNDSILWHARLGHESFQNVKRETEVLDLIHSDLCDLHATPSLGNKKHFVTFIDDASRFCYVYLLHTKDEALDKFKVFKTKVELQQGARSKDLGLIGEDAIFDENRFLLVPRPSQRSMINGTEDIGGSVVPEKVTKEDVVFWKESINDEMDSIMGNNTWVLADLPLGCKPLGCKWIFKIKLNVDETIEKFNARLVIQGFRQNLGIDYFDTYAPVAHIRTIRLLIALASIYNMIIHQMDVKTTFLNGELDEEQAPKKWHQKFDEVILSCDYLLNQDDKCVYSKFDESGKGDIICLYVDDMLIFGTNQVQIDLIKEFLSSRFSMKDMGEANVILGIRIKHESNDITISQSHYIEKVLKKFNYFDCTLVNTPIDTSEKLMPNNGQAVSQLEYSRVIGFLMYAMTCTRPDIAFVVGKVSRYTSNHNTQHWQAIPKVLKCLKKTMDYSLTYISYPSVLEGYTDASWISNTKDNPATSGWVFLLGGAAGKEAEWLTNPILKISLRSKHIAPISISCDSAATLAKIADEVQTSSGSNLSEDLSLAD